MAISAHAATGIPGKSTFSLLLTIGGKWAVPLVDSGSSDTFMSKQFVEQNNIITQQAPITKVIVAGGAHKLSDACLPSTQFSVQGHRFESTFKILPLKTFDMILGADWIYEYSPIGLDLKKRELVVTKNGTPIKMLDHTLLQLTR